MVVGRGAGEMPVGAGPGAGGGGVHVGSGPGPGCVVGAPVGSGSVIVGSGLVGAGSVGEGPVGEGPVGDGPVGAGPVGAGPVGPGFVGVGGTGEVGLVPQPTAAAEAHPMALGSSRSADSATTAVSAARRGTAADVTAAILHYFTTAESTARASGLKRRHPLLFGTLAGLTATRRMMTVE